MPWLLDTNILSEFATATTRAGIMAFISDSPLDDLYISVVSLAEIRYGIELSADATRRTLLHDWLIFKVRPMFDNHRTLPVTEDIMLKWRVMLAEGRKTGHTFSQPELIIAATAAQHGLTVVTRDQSHYVRARVPILNPWETSR